MLNLYLISIAACIVFFILASARIKVIVKKNDIKLPKNSSKAESAIELIRMLVMFSLPIINIIFTIIFINLFIFCSDAQLLKYINKQINKV